MRTKYLILFLSLLFVTACSLDGAVVNDEDLVDSSVDFEERLIEDSNYVADVTESDDDGITLDELSFHNSADSCWVGYNGYVYDLTPFLNRHPGGADAITPHCGTVEEFTESYNNRHGEKPQLRRNEAIGSLI